MAGPAAARSGRPDWASGRAIWLSVRLARPQPVTVSLRQPVKNLIAEARNRQKAVEVSFEEQDGGRVVIPAGEAPKGGADIWLVVYDEEHETEVARGENAGRALKDYNVVRELQHLGHWKGEAMTIPLQLDAAAKRGRAGCAVIVQHRDTKEVLGAGLMRVEQLASN